MCSFIGQPSLYCKLPFFKASCKVPLASYPATGVNHTNPLECLRAMRSYSGCVTEPLSLTVHLLTSSTSKWFLKNGVVLWQAKNSLSCEHLQAAENWGRGRVMSELLSSSLVLASCNWYVLVLNSFNTSTKQSWRVPSCPINKETQTRVTN